MAKMRIIGMAEAQPNLNQLVEDVNQGGDPYFIVANNKVKAVLVGIGQYNNMMEQIGDMNTPTGTSVVP